MDIKNVFALISLIFSLALFIPYYINIYRGTAKPHLFSWLTWGVLVGIGFYLSLQAGGGVGSWNFAVISVLCLGVALYALIKGEKNIAQIDWVFFISAIIIMTIYIFTKNAVISVTLAAITDSSAFFPTLRKSISKPFDEPALTYFFSGSSFLFSLGALQNYSFVTTFYPLMMVVVNFAFVTFILIRRRVVSSH
jgi:hypothetical protein